MLLAQVTSLFLSVMRWQAVPFPDLSATELYEALALRQLVFVVEQTCAYLDCDGKDLVATHLLGRDEGGQLVAYARLLPPGVSFAEASIGRVATHPSVRRTGAGRALMREAIARTRTLFGEGPIRIGAQRYLERFYGELGFEIAGPPYDEDGIPHVEMLLPARASVSSGG
jgi:ElaA protein